MRKQIRRQACRRRTATLIWKRPVNIPLGSLYSENLHVSFRIGSPRDGRLYFANAGKGYVVQAGPELRILAVNDLGDPNHPSPAVAQGRLFLVGLKNVYCIGQAK
jgi:hypothetical protein